MKIIICGSISAADEIVSAKTELEELGHTVEIPEGVKHLQEWGGAADSNSAKRKIEHDLIRGYYEKMKSYDKVLIVNPRKKDIEGYIGGNTLIEMAFALILNKPIYLLHAIPEISYKAEIAAMQPILLNGDISKIG